jgi:hypothetical protein
VQAQPEELSFRYVIAALRAELGQAAAAVGLLPVCQPGNPAEMARLIAFSPRMPPLHHRH